MSQEQAQAHIRVRDLTLKYGSKLIQQDLTFDVNKNDIFIIMGGSGCGKSTLLKHMMGLYRPAEGQVWVDDNSLWDVSDLQRRAMMKNFGVSYQAGALISSLTLAENVGMPLELYTELSPKEVAELASLKLSMVGLAGFEGYYPSEISGGMIKRAALARAIALDPEILFFDEPSAGLDPISARLLDDLILELRESMKSTIVIVTHELASIFSIGSNAVFLDADTQTMLATGNPNQLLASCDDAKVQQFLRRGEAANA
ncbi:ABC transporter ATP-binding protein [Alkalimarinus alittae]|uniref:ATP-binding cassette domain-containing protein n=1 Tax=Alkalimarinus alittae TaxID=2961619 RepID=A0ABY6N3C3_9ALTE|nr:ATP-binding cassette domain-containing protein [Alkalimarinus alittae]UZE96497.1 ATP-binding cassette domain-containing protein [Alkalimarinus alittae]